MNTILGKDEQIIKEATFTSNLILFWLKSNYILTNKRVTGHAPNTLFGLIPLGEAQISMPLKSIASVTSSTNFSIVRLIIGFIFLQIGSVASSFVALVMVLLGIVNIFNCFTATFIITNNGGQKTGYEISILEKSKVVAFVNEINAIIADL